MQLVPLLDVSGTEGIAMIVLHVITSLIKNIIFLRVNNSATHHDHSPCICELPDGMLFIRCPVKLFMLQAVLINCHF